MAPMKEKIKNFFGFVGRAWSGGIRGKVGILFALFAGFMFIRVFWGDVNVQKFIINIWHLRAEQQTLAEQPAELDALRRHIDLLQNYSPDYVEELGLKYLNMGPGDVKILKI